MAQPSTTTGQTMRTGLWDTSYEWRTVVLLGVGFGLVGLGPRTLRVDTACTAVLAITHASIELGSG